MSAVAAAARALVGAPFRLHGRDAAGGLDCVGVVALALQGGGHRVVVPSGYALRGGDPASVIARIDAVLARAAADAPGDIVLTTTGPGQLHLAVRVAGGFVHADAGLRRVVMRPGEPPWPLLAAWAT
ncbi:MULTISPECIES: peptidoglycan endopeptidase [unclassified Sphingomonas]|uniref:peptidoglycan endopeptidase n=1 Tax=unclassified Sphingomonas TaxID=196159 RepID=UPI001F55DD9A|nr:MULTISPECIES: peptidoglycan endopeptidase [unclassified Sphingomonas]